MGFLFSAHLQVEAEFLLKARDRAETLVEALGEAYVWQTAAADFGKLAGILSDAFLPPFTWVQ